MEQARNRPPGGTTIYPTRPRSPSPALDFPPSRAFWLTGGMEGRVARESWLLCITSFSSRALGYFLHYRRVRSWEMRVRVIRPRGGNFEITREWCTGVLGFWMILGHWHDSRVVRPNSHHSSFNCTRIKFTFLPTVPTSYSLVIIY